VENDRGVLPLQIKIIIVLLYVGEKRGMKVNLGKQFNTVCPTRYRTRHFFNNSNTNEVSTFVV